MHIDKIKINNFKNYISTEVKFSNKINFLFGKNGAGKTNLLDAIHYLSYGKSAINNFDSDNILIKKTFFKIEGDYSNNLSYKCTFEHEIKRLGVIFYLIWCKFNNRIVISNIINNKYTDKKFNMKINKLSSPKYWKNNIKIKERKTLKNVEIMMLLIV